MQSTGDSRSWSSDLEASRRSSRTPCCGRVTNLSADSSTPCGLGSSLTRSSCSRSSTETLRVGRDASRRRHRQWPDFPPQLRDLYAEDGSGARSDGGAREIRSQETSETRRALTEMTLAMSRDSTGLPGSWARSRRRGDWRRWDERMNWILTLLRSRQQDDTLVLESVLNSRFEADHRGRAAREFRRSRGARRNRRSGSACFRPNRVFQKDQQ